MLHYAGVEATNVQLSLVVQSVESALRVQASGLTAHEAAMALFHEHVPWLLALMQSTSCRVEQDLGGAQAVAVVADHAQLVFVPQSVWVWSVSQAWS